MKTIELKNIESFIVISDVHLQNPEDTGTQKFLDTLNSIKNTDALFLLGDIFDFIAINCSFFMKLWKNVFDKFKELKQNGLRIFFIEGNHDFGFEHFHNSILDECFEIYGDYIIELNHLQCGWIQLRHGDDVVCPENYLAFRKVVKHKIFQNLTTKLVTGRLMNTIFLKYAHISRKKSSHYTLTNEFLNSCILKLLKQNPKIQILIIGHIHISLDTMVENTRLLVGLDWITQPNFLSYTPKSNFQRVTL